MPSAPSREAVLPFPRPGRAVMVWSLPAMGLLLGAVYAWSMSPGLPYDEPSHWSNVLFYANHARLPILGRPGVTYEAQMGPVAYALDAMLVRAAQAVGVSLEGCFRLVRLLGVVEFAAAVAVIGSLTRRLVPRGHAWAVAVAVFALNPMLLAMSASVQNDTLSLLLGLLTLELAIRLLTDRPTARWAAIVGAVGGLAVLTKLTSLSAVAAVAGWLMWRHRSKAAPLLVAFLGSAVLVSGWWFYRNVALYGDPTAAAGVRRTGVSFPPYGVHGTAGLVHILEQVVTYLWLPTEYFRNLFGAPGPLKAAVLVTTVVITIVGVHEHRRFGHAATLVIGCGFLSIGSWLVMYLGFQAVAPRVAYLALPAWIGLVALTLARLGARTALVATAVTVATLNIWTLYELSRLHPLPFLVLHT